MLTPLVQRSVGWINGVAIALNMVSGYDAHSGGMRPHEEMSHWDAFAKCTALFSEPQRDFGPVKNGLCCMLNIDLWQPPRFDSQLFRANIRFGYGCRSR